LYLSCDSIGTLSDTKSCQGTRAGGASHPALATQADTVPSLDGKGLITLCTRRTPSIFCSSSSSAKSDFMLVLDPRQNESRNYRAWLRYEKSRRRSARNMNVEAARAIKRLMQRVPCMRAYRRSSWIKSSILGSSAVVQETTNEIAYSSHTMGRRPELQC
jgi:hypothetical protein